MEFQTGSFKIRMDNRWELEDLYKFPRAFEQVYFAYFALSSSRSEIINEQIAYAFSSYPWKGGYSVVNFYNKLKYSIPKSERPTISSISYASPGWLDLNLVQEIALNVGIVVGSICGSIKLVNSTYNSIYKGMQKRKLTKLEIQKEEFSLSKDHYEFLRQANNEMGSILGLRDIDDINQKTGNELRTLKILLSIYRRIRTLAKYEENGKARLPKTAAETDDPPPL